LQTPPYSELYLYAVFPPRRVCSLGPLLKHLHVSENDRGLLGSGHVDFPGFVAALKQIDYDGYLMIEGFG
jgi:D-psicose/D-tagatose/L-ribulose 3-epimerase